MFSLQTMFGRADKVKDLLEASAQISLQSAQAVDQLTHNIEDAPAMQVFNNARMEEKQLAAELSAKMVDSFVMAFDREDIEALNSALYRIPKTIERFAERYVLVVERLDGIEFTPQSRILVECAELIVEMVAELRNGFRIGHMRKLQDHLQELEEKADLLLLEPYDDLYATTSDPMRAVLAKNLYGIMEKAINNCRDVGNIVYSIVLKNS